MKIGRFNVILINFAPFCPTMRSSSAAASHILTPVSRHVSRPYRLALANRKLGLRHSFPWKKKGAQGCFFHSICHTYRRMQKSTVEKGSGYVMRQCARNDIFYYIRSFQENKVA